MASCTQIDNLLQGYIDDELAQSERVILDQHVAECAACQKLLRQQQRSSAELFEVFNDYRLTRDLTKGVMEHLPDMESQMTDVEGVNWRAKHPAVYRERALRLVPVAVIVLLAIMAGGLSSNWPGPALASDLIGAVTYRAGEASRTEPEAANASLQSVVLPGEYYTTGPNSSLMLSLLGPTHIKLNENTSLRVHNDRTITLEEGQAHFKVSKGLKRFTVNTSTGTITVTGTEFDVIVNNLSTVVTVQEGKVRLTHGTRENSFIFLNAGEQAKMQPDMIITPPRRVDADRRSSWAEAINADVNAMAFFNAEVLPRGSVQEIQAARMSYRFPVNNQSLQSIELQWTQDRSSYGQPCGYEVYVYTGVDQTPIFRDLLDSSLFLGDSKYVLQNTGDMKPITGYVWVDLIPIFTQGTREVNFALPTGIFTSEQ